MKEPKARRGRPETDIFELNDDEPYDRLRAQILVHIDQLISPPSINWEEYDITYTIPRQQTTALKIDTPEKYEYLLKCAHNIKSNPGAKILVEAKTVR